MSLRVRHGISIADPGRSINHPARAAQCIAAGRSPEHAIVSRAVGRYSPNTDTVLPLAGAGSMHFDDPSATLEDLSSRIVSIRDSL